MVEPTMGGMVEPTTLYRKVIVEEEVNKNESTRSACALLNVQAERETTSTLLPVDRQKEGGPPTATLKLQAETVQLKSEAVPLSEPELLEPQTRPFKTRVIRIMCRWGHSPDAPVKEMKNPWPMVQLFQNAISDHGKG